MLHPGEVGVARGRLTKLPALVVAQTVTAPIAVIEVRISKNKIRPEIRMSVVVKSVAVSDLSVDAADGEIHARQAPGGVVRLLSVDAYSALGLATVTVSLRVCIDEPDRLDEHSSRPGARIIDPALVGFEHLD